MFSADVRITTPFLDSVFQIRNGCTNVL